MPKLKLNGHNHDPSLFLSSDDSADEERVSLAPDIEYVEANVTSTPAIERETTIPIPEAQSHQDPIPIENILAIEAVDPASTAVAQILEMSNLLQWIETHLLILPSMGITILATMTERVQQR